ncbi:MAG TPA: MarR family transcriptional regulator [Nocardioidaceae bacterium]|nr:MarR family transcriptional regulator [Nocardioidaceae bacterium]
MAKISEDDYTVLLVFRTAVRRFLQWSAAEAGRLGLSSQQHQFLLAVRAHHAERPPSISELSEILLLRHHSVVELANRVQKLGLVTRVKQPGDDRRVVRVQLTEKGRQVIDDLAGAHMAELLQVVEMLGISEELLGRLSREFADQLGWDLHDPSESG